MSIPESHLAQEAIAALVDGELPAGAADRAARHLGGCLQCRLAVEAQREAKDALHGSRDVAVPGDLMSRLCAIPFTTDVPVSGGPGGGIAAGPGELTVSGPSGSWAVDLRPPHPQRPGHARWLRRGLAGTIAGLGAGVTALALQLPASGGGDPADPGPRPVADASIPDEHTGVVHPVIRTVTAGTTAASPGAGGTP